MAPPLGRLAALSLALGAALLQVAGAWEVGNNGGGSLLPDEVEAAHREDLIKDLDPSSAAEVFKSFDMNGDGILQMTDAGKGNDKSGRADFKAISVGADGSVELEDRSSARERIFEELRKHKTRGTARPPQRKTPVAAVEVARKSPALLEAQTGIDYIVDQKVWALRTVDEGTDNLVQHLWIEAEIVQKTDNGKYKVKEDKTGQEYEFPVNRIMERDQVLVQDKEDPTLWRNAVLVRKDANSHRYSVKFRSELENDVHNYVLEDQVPENRVRRDGFEPHTKVSVANIENRGGTYHASWVKAEVLSREADNNMYQVKYDNGVSKRVTGSNISGVTSEMKRCLTAAGYQGNANDFFCGFMNTCEYAVTVYFKWVAPISLKNRHQVDRDQVELVINFEATEIPPGQKRSVMVSSYRSQDEDYTFLDRDESNFAGSDACKPIFGSQEALPAAPIQTYEEGTECGPARPCKGYATAGTRAGSEGCRRGCCPQRSVLGNSNDAETWPSVWTCAEKSTQTVDVRITSGSIASFRRTVVSYEAWMKTEGSSDEVVIKRMEKTTKGMSFGGGTLGSNYCEEGNNKGLILNPPLPLNHMDSKWAGVKAGIKKLVCEVGEEADFKNDGRCFFCGSGGRRA